MCDLAPVNVFYRRGQEVLRERGVIKLKALVKCQKFDSDDLSSPYTRASNV